MTDKWPEFLDKRILDVIANDLKFTTMTPVQKIVVPILAQQHKDVVVEAITGSGKTLAFVVPIIHLLGKPNAVATRKKHDINALIISPTRELAQQIHSIVEMFTASSSDGLNQRLTSMLLVGGNSVNDDIKQFRAQGANIVVATAGRLADMLTRGGGGGGGNNSAPPNGRASACSSSFNMRQQFKTLDVLILDEADRLLDMGFKEAIETILKHLPKQRRTGLFSATQTDEIDKLIRAGLRNPCCIQVKQKTTVGVRAQKTPLELNNFYVIVEPEEKFARLVAFLAARKDLKTIVFMSSCACVQYFGKLLKNLLKSNGTQVMALHRKVNEKRGQIFDEFKRLNSGVLVCTDIMARGIDMDDVDWVVQYDAPKLAASFVHRCGRTARSGRAGSALLFLLPNEDCYVKFILINQQVPLEVFVDDVDSVVATSLSPFASAASVIQLIHSLAVQERELYEKGKQAFVSFIRAYSKHECSHIFQIKELDMVGLAKGFGLLHMPKMPEIARELCKTKLSDIDTSTIPYKDKVREKARNDEAAAADKKKKVVKRASKATSNKSWSNNEERKLKRKIRVEKKQLAEKKRKNDGHVDDDDINELHNDFKLLKKFKRKKISEEEFDKTIELDSS